MRAGKTGSALRAAWAIVLASLLAGVCAATARAEPLSMTFTESRANVGVQLADAALFEAPATAPFAAQIDPGSGLIADGVLTVPDFSTFITEPVDADVTVAFEIGVITGSFNQATGVLALSGTAGGTLTADGKTCDVTVPGVLTLSSIGSSGGASPRSGRPFTAGIRGAGAIAGQWADMNATPVDEDDETVCETVDERIGGPGGVWLEQKGDVVPSPPPGTDPPTPSTNVAPPVLGPSDAPPTCVVPKLAGKTLKQARRALKRVGCKVGEVQKPKQRKGKKRRALVVKRSTPRRGATPADGKVDLTLGPKPKPKQKARR